MLRKDLWSWLGIAVGGMALMLAMVHFYAGPFSPQPSLESLVVDKAIAIKESLQAVLTGKLPSSGALPFHYHLDRILKIVVAILAVGAVILGVIGHACRESYRVAIGAIMLGVGTLVFQFAIFAFGVIAVIFFILAVLSLVLG